MSLDFLPIIATAGAVASVLASILTQYFERKHRGKETLEERINKLTSALSESSRLVTEVEREIQTRQNLVVELKNDAEKYQKLVSLNQEQVDAVAQLLQGELRKEGTKSFWMGFAVNFIFFVLGALVSWVTSHGF